MILRFVIGGIVIYLLFKLLRAWKSPGGERAGKHPAVPGEDLVEDPYCHTYVPVSHALKAVVAGKTLYFCSQPCLDAYKKREKT